MKNHRHASCCFCRPPNIHSRSQRSHIYSYFSLHVLHAFMYIHSATTRRADACEARARVFHARDKGQRETLFKPDTSNHRARWKIRSGVCPPEGRQSFAPLKTPIPDDHRLEMGSAISQVDTNLSKPSFSFFSPLSLELKSPLLNASTIRTLSNVFGN